jgi:RNase P subunit RPR2
MSISRIVLVKIYRLFCKNCFTILLSKKFQAMLQGGQTNEAYNFS